MATRDGKEWLESVTLDEDDMSSDSDTDVATQSSIKAYADSVRVYAPTATLTLETLPLSATPYPVTHGGMYLVDNNTSTVITVSLPTAVGHVGKRIRILVSRNVGGLIIDPLGAEQIYNQDVLNTKAAQFCIDIVATASPVPNWLPVSSSNQIILGDDGSLYPTDITLIDIAGSDNDVKLQTDSTITGAADGLKLVCSSSGGFKAESTGGNAYLVAQCPDANTGQIKLVHDTSGSEWRITNTATTHLYQLRPGANPQVYVANYTTGQMGIGTISPGVNSPLRIGGVNVTTINVPTFADNAAAKTGGLTDGELYRTATGQLMIVFT